jgi:hypothetical protein
MPDYSRGKIYLVKSDKCKDIYVGSTTQELGTRMIVHKSMYKRWKNNESAYYTCFDIMDHGDAYIELYEEFPCESKKELTAREGEVIQSINCVNKHIAGRTRKQWHVDNKEYVARKKKEYAEKNKEHLAAYKKQWVIDNKEHVQAQRRQRYQENKEAIRAKQKIYTDSRKAEKAAYDKEYRKNRGPKERIRVDCEICGINTCKDDLRRHQRSKKCFQAAEILEFILH